MISIRQLSVVFLCLSLALPAASRGQAAERRLTVQDCIAMGVERSAATRNAARDVAIGRAQVIQARADGLPRLDLSASYTRLDETDAFELGGDVVELGVLDNYSATAELSQTLYAGGRVFAALRAARLSRDYYAEQEMETRHALARDIRLAFHGVLLAEAVVGVQEASLAQWEAHAEETGRKYRAGTASELDWLSARVRAANEQTDSIGARNAVRLAWVALRRLLNAEHEAFGLEGQLTCRPLKAELADLTVLEAMGRQRPLMQALEKVARLRETDVDAARAESRPRISAFFRYHGANSYQFAALDDWQWHWNAGVRAEWAVWDGGLAMGRRREKNLRYEQSVEELDAAAVAVRAEIKRAFLEVERAADAVQASASGVELAERAMGLAEVRFDNGLATGLEYADSQLALSRARLGRLSALRDHMDAVANLEYACGLEPGRLGE